MTKQSITAVALDKRGRVLSVGKNSYVKTHTVQAHFSNKVGRPHAVFIHAEVDALLKARGDVHTLRVFRYSSDGSARLAKPCAACMLAIEHFGVRVVEWTTGDDTKESMKVKRRENKDR